MQFQLRRNTVKVIVVVCGLLLLFVGGFFLLRAIENNQQLPTVDGDYITPVDQQKPVVYFGNQAYTLRDDLKTLLLLGIDNEGPMKSSGSYMNDGQNDVVTLLVLDEKANQYTLLHLNRDTMTQVQRIGIDGTVVDKAKMQLALAHSYGDGMKQSCENSVTAVRELLYDTPIQHYLAINMSGLERIVDAIGGVTVTIQGDFSQIDPTLVEGETMTLTGSQCLTYLRGRRDVGEQTNLERSERQRQFLMELLPQFRADESLGETALLSVTDYMLTDMPVAALETMTEKIVEADLAQILSPEGEAVKGDTYMEYYVDEAALRELVVKTFYQPVTEDQP